MRLIAGRRQTVIKIHRRGTCGRSPDALNKRRSRAISVVELGYVTVHVTVIRRFAGGEQSEPSIDGAANRTHSFADRVFADHSPVAASIRLLDTTTFTIVSRAGGILATTASQNRMVSRRTRLSVLTSMILAAVLVRMAFGQSPGPAVWVAVCSDSASSPADVRATYEAPDGRVQTTHVAAMAPVGCVATRLPIAYEDVVWVRLVAPATANRLSRGLILLGGDGVPSSGSEIVLPDETSQAPTQVSAVSSNRSSALSEGQPPIRAMWAWRPELWRSEASSLFAQASSWNVGVLYVSVQVGADGALVDADRLRAFLGDAGDRRLRVWAVEGDPRAVMEAERTAMVQRARAIRSFNSQEVPDSMACSTTSNHISSLVTR